MSAFRRARKGGARASFPPLEANLLRNLSRQLIELLRDDARRSQGDGDSLESLFDFDEPVSAPQDPVLARLLPDAYDDEEKAAEFRRFTERGLRDAKVVQATTVIESLERGGLGEDGLRIRSIAEGAAACEDVGEGVAGDVDLDAAQFVGRHRNINIVGISSYSFDRTALAPEFANDDAGLSSVVLGDLGDLG